MNIINLDHQLVPLIFQLSFLFFVPAQPLQHLFFERPRRSIQQSPQSIHLGLQVVFFHGLALQIYFEPNLGPQVSHFFLQLCHCETFLFAVFKGTLQCCSELVYFQFTGLVLLFHVVQSALLNGLFQLLEGTVCATDALLVTQHFLLELSNLVISLLVEVGELPDFLFLLLNLLLQLGDHICLGLKFIVQPDDMLIFLLYFLLKLADGYFLLNFCYLLSLLVRRRITELANQLSAFAGSGLSLFGISIRSGRLVDLRVVNLPGPHILHVEVLQRRSV